MVSPVILIGAGLGIVTIVALSSSKSSGKARDSGRLDKYVMGWPGGIAQRDRMIELGTSGNQAYNPKYGYDSDEAKRLWNEAFQKFQERRQFLPNDAAGTADRYSKEKYLLPVGMTYPWPSFGSVDEFGRAPEGLPSNFGPTVLKITQQVLPLVPGVGPVAAGTLAYAIAVGQGKSQKDAIIAGARAAIPIQYQLAFDMGVGVASGESVDKAALNAFFKNNPEKKEAYEKGKAMLPGVKVFPLP